MAYFPFFADISGAKCLVVGGGRVALRKIQKLMSFGPKIKVVAPDICEEILQMNLEIYRRKFECSDLDNADFVISATNDENVSMCVYKLCKERRIPVNTVDDQARCSFIFPALAICGDTAVGISTGGKSPLFASRLRSIIEEMLCGQLGKTGELLGEIRPYVKEIFPDEQSSKNAMDTVFDLCMSCERFPTIQEVYKILDDLRSKDENQNRNT